MREEIRSAIIEFLKDNYVSSEGIGGDEPLFEKNILDSLGMLQLLTFLEERFNVSLGSEDLVWENLFTINKIVETVVRLQTRESRLK